MTLSSSPLTSSPLPLSASPLPLPPSRFPLTPILHTRQKITQFAVKLSNPGIRFIDPPGFFSFISLERNAFCVLSDSGTVQEECCIFKVPNVTLRDVTERPETIECGSNILSGDEPEAVLRCVRAVLSSPPNWIPPREYLEKDVSKIVLKIIQGYHPVFSESRMPAKFMVSRSVKRLSSNG